MDIKKINFLLLMLCFGFFSTISSYGQLSVEVGKDTTYCTNVSKMYLGDKLIIKNGVEPYSIKWECKVPKGLYSYFTASDLLSDTTDISPFFTYTPPNNQWIKFTVHITDGKNNYAEDSIRVRFSKFGYLTGYAGIEIKEGDSILFNYSSVGGGIEPLEYQWQPKTGLTNPDSLVTWCKPNSTTQYDIIVTDSCGCVSNPNTVYYVMVLPTGLNEVKNDDRISLNIRQNGNWIYFNNPDKKEAHITLWSINGKAQYNITITEDHFKIGNLLKTKGIYIVKITVGELASSSKLINL
jgi:hypothetical protein